MSMIYRLKNLSNTENLQLYEDIWFEAQPTSITLLTSILFVQFVYFIFKYLAQLILCLLGLGSGLFPFKLYIPGNVVHLCTS